MSAEHTALRRLDYRPPDHRVTEVALTFEIHDDGTEVEAALQVHRAEGVAADAPLVLYGVDLEVLGVQVDGAARELRREGEAFLLDGVGGSAETPVEVRTRVRIHPESNTALEGLYRTQAGFFLTQCEPEGFRKITLFPDRPDVLARYQVVLRADKQRYPVLLANGNPTGQRDLDGGRHEATWVDPFPKPSYLFAVVAGDLEHIEQKFETCSGRSVTVRIYTEARNLDQCDHAMDSLLRAMKWDEEAFGLECDLDHYNVVATDDFNMGAMENKGLNIFNSKYVLARPDTATDGDYAGIEGVIGHEYFHNWTGNRVTCRDWFQLSLKEGLTVYRDQLFSAAMGSVPVERIGQVRGLRTAQFAEDAGPQAHPVRPDEVVEINNFYTTTVYEKGAEVVRMYAALLGEEGFRKGFDLYIERHDGEAATCEDFARAMADSSGVDLEQFMLWYSQSGTPAVEVTAIHEPRSGRYTLRFTQSCPPTPGQPTKRPFHIPVAIGLVDSELGELPGTARVVELRKELEEVVFEGVEREPVPSLLRGFSAPVQLRFPYTREELAVLMARDTDPFNRWDAGQRLALDVLLEAIGGSDKVPVAPKQLLDPWRAVLTDGGLDRALRAQALVLPGETYLGDQLAVIDPDRVHDVRRGIRRQLGEALAAPFWEEFRACSDEREYRFDAAAVGKRSFKNTCLAYLVSTGDSERAVTGLPRASSSAART